MNVKLLQAIKKHILAEPKRLDMGNWGFKRDKANDGPACGTVGCIAGWAVLLTHPSLIGRKEDFTPAKLKKFSNAMGNAEEDAPGLLKINIGTADRLFYVDRWPEPFRQDYLDAESGGDRKAMAKATAARIDSLISMGG